MLSMLLASVVLLIPVITILGALVALYHFKKDNTFTVFLSHHKAAAGALCRLLSIVLQEHMAHKGWS